MPELLVTGEVRADPSTTFAAFTSAAALARWWWPHIPDTTYAVDARVGGAYEIRSQAAGIGVRGELLELDEPHFIQMTWIWLDGAEEGPTEEVRVGFTERGDGTLVTVEHSLAPASGDGSDLRQGWESVLGRLAGVPSPTAS